MHPTNGNNERITKCIVQHERCIMSAALYKYPNYVDVCDIASVICSSMLCSPIYYIRYVTTFCWAKYRKTVDMYETYVPLYVLYVHAS